jgi:hypothetical protein
MVKEKLTAIYISHPPIVRAGAALGAASAIGIAIIDSLASAALNVSSWSGCRLTGPDE